MYSLVIAILKKLIGAYALIGRFLAFILNPKSTYSIDNPCV